MAGCAKGVIRSVLINKDYHGECIPVDYAISGLITIAYEFATATKKEEQIPVYNVTCADHRKKPWGYVIEKSKEIGYSYPLDAGLWYPNAVTTTNRLYHQLNCILFMWLPAYFIDGILLLLGQKRFMIRVQEKIAVGLEVLQFFTMNNWQFDSVKFESVWKRLTAKDKELFLMDMDNDMPENDYIINSCKGGRVYIMKEDLKNLPRARTHLMYQYIADCVCKTLFCVLAAHYLMKWTGLYSLFGVFGY